MDQIGNSDDEYKPSAFDLDADDLDKPTLDHDVLAKPPPPAKAIAKAAKDDDVNLDPAALYRAEIRRSPMLEAEEERLLAKRWREHGDIAARDKLVNSHLRLVARIARDLTNYGRDYRQRLLGAISEGNDALMQAAKSFDPSLGNRFSSYAKVAIKRAIKDYIWRSRSIVKISDDFNEKLFALTLEKNKIGRLDDNALLRDEVKCIAERLGRTEEDVIKLNAQSQLGSADASLNAPPMRNHNDDDGEDCEEQDQLVDEAPDPQTQLIEAEESPIRKEALRWAALAVLDERERRIFEARWLTDEPITFRELAAKEGVHAERVRQIGERAVEKVRASEKVQQVLEDRTPKPVQSAAKNHTAALVHATCYFGGPPDWQDRPPPTAGKLVDGLTRKWHILLRRYYEHSPRWSPRWRKIVREITRKRRRAIEYPSTASVRRMISLFSLGEAIGRTASPAYDVYEDGAPPDLRLRDQLEAERKAGAEDAEAKRLAAEKHEIEDEEAADRCGDCDARVHGIGEWFMVRNELWGRAWKGRKSRRHFGTRPGETLCTGCLEKRIGGELVLANFADSPSAAARDLAEIGHKLIFGHFAIGRKSSSCRVGVPVNELVWGKHEPALSISQDNWRAKQRKWNQEGSPKTEWPEIQGKPFIVRGSVKAELRALGVAALEKFLAEGRGVQVCSPKATAQRRHSRVMKFTWFPDGQAYEAMWEDGQLAQFERDKWLASRAETDAAPRKLEPQPLLGPRYPSAKSTRAYAGYSSLPVELRMLALGLPLPDRPDGFALAAE